MDVLVLFPDGETVAATLQVKSRTPRQAAWIMKDKHEQLVDKHVFYTFVDLGQEPPVTWIIPSAVVAEVVRKEHAAWLAAPGRGGTEHRKDTPMRLLRNDYPFPVAGYPAGWMDPLPRAMGSVAQGRRRGRLAAAATWPAEDLELTGVI